MTLLQSMVMPPFHVTLLHVACTNFTTGTVTAASSGIERFLSNGSKQQQDSSHRVVNPTFTSAAVPSKPNPTQKRHIQSTVTTLLKQQQQHHNGVPSEVVRCPICSSELRGNNATLNSHIDVCLTRQSCDKTETASHVIPASKKHRSTIDVFIRPKHDT